MFFSLKRPTYQVLNQITVDTGALSKNYTYFAKRHPKVGIVPILKSNAYGHGLIPTAAFIDKKLTPPLIGVDSLFEAYELSKHHIKTPILILGYTLPDNYHLHKHLPFSFSVFDSETLLALNRYQPGARIHIKLDTGMCRLGLLSDDLDDFMAVLKICTSLKVGGIYSHFSQADLNQDFTRQQIAAFKTMVTRFEAKGYRFTYKHISATAGATWIDDPYFNLIRLGLGFYGYAPAPIRELHPALTLTSRLAQVKTIPAKSVVGYGGTFATKAKTTIGILPIGYADGISREFSNQGIFTTQDQQPCPIRGRVSMNMTTIEVPANLSAGDLITVINPDPKAVNSAYQLAKNIDTIPYTILTGLNPTIRRVFA